MVSLFRVSFSKDSTVLVSFYNMDTFPLLLFLGLLTGTFTCLNISAPLTTSSRAMSWGVVTSTAPTGRETPKTGWCTCVPCFDVRHTYVRMYMVV